MPRGRSSARRAAPKPLSPEARHALGRVYECCCRIAELRDAGNLVWLNRQLALLHYEVADALEAEVPLARIRGVRDTVMPREFRVRFPPLP